MTRTKKPIPVPIDLQLSWLAAHNDLPVRDYLRIHGEDLTPRQFECLALKMEGKSYREIGKDLGISHVSVYHHVLAAAKKLFTVS